MTGQIGTRGVKQAEMRPDAVETPQLRDIVERPDTDLDPVTRLGFGGHAARGIERQNVMASGLYLCCHRASATAEVEHPRTLPHAIQKGRKPGAGGVCSHQFRVVPRLGVVDRERLCVRQAQNSSPSVRQPTTRSVRMLRSCIHQAGASPSRQKP